MSFFSLTVLCSYTFRCFYNLSYTKLKVNFFSQGKHKNHIFISTQSQTKPAFLFHPETAVSGSLYYIPPLWQWPHNHVSISLAFTHTHKYQLGVMFPIMVENPNVHTSSWINIWCLVPPVIIKKNDAFISQPPATNRSLKKVTGPYVYVNWVERRLCVAFIICLGNVCAS